jgi:hypothetical protein
VCIYIYIKPTFQRNGVAESEESMSIAEKERYKGVEGPGGVDYL